MTTMRAKFPEIELSSCSEYIEDAAICDDEGEAKGQCGNCGAKWYEHTLDVLPEHERDGAAMIQAERGVVNRSV